MDTRTSSLTAAARKTETIQRFRKESGMERRMDREARRGQKEEEIKGMKSNQTERQRQEPRAHMLIHKTPSDLISYITSR